jgi:hypothetical protein
LKGKLSSNNEKKGALAECKVGIGGKGKMTVLCGHKGRNQRERNGPHWRATAVWMWRSAQG